MNGFVTKANDEGRDNEEKSKGYRKSSVVQPVESMKSRKAKTRISKVIR